MTLEPRHQKTRAVLDSIRAGGCVVCGETDVDVLDFHHVDPAEKSFNVSASWRKKGLQTVLEEVAKCVVVCANCHRRLHAGTAEIPEGTCRSLPSSSSRGSSS